jgi:flagellar M-ring protein FliF
VSTPDDEGRDVELKDRLAGLARALPPAQRAGIVVAMIVLVMAAVPFVRWVTTPSYTLLYAGLEERQLGEVTTELDEQGIPFQLDGSRILVPQDQLHLVRANLAQAGMSGSPSVPGYELLDEQALGVSDFRQRVDLQRAVEGELSRTLGAMDSLDSATVRLVLPDDPLFTDQRTPATASVLVRPTRQLDQGQIEAITLLVSSAVEGLGTDGITVADTTGNVLHAPGDGSTGGVTDRQQRRTRDFESAMAADLTRLLQRATDAPASVVVRATLDFDETETQTETFDETGTALRESVNEERYEGTGPAAGGTVGVDGGPLLGGAGEGNYERGEEVREFGVGRTTTRVVQAPGTVEQLSVALVVSEGAAVGDAELQTLIAAAAGVDEERGDRVAITRVATPPLPEAADGVEGMTPMELVRTGVALLVLLVVAVALFLMSRKRRDNEPEPHKVVPAQVAPQRALAPEPTEEALPVGPSIKDEVAELVERQPEEIAALLRGWLADRRTSV